MSRNRKPRHRSGFAVILGRPNAGKSTLLNALVGAKLAIVADKPQTTRTTIQGVLTLENAQVVFVDTPGIHQADSVFNRRMMQSIGEAIEEPDIALYLHDATRAFEEEADVAALDMVRRAGAKWPFLVLTKLDRLANKAHLLPLIARFNEAFQFREILPLSALTGEGLDDLRKLILKRIPVGPAYFPEDHITDQPERFMASELIREKILAETRQEVPHSVAVQVNEWLEEGRLLRITATIHVERTGQKVIILGEKGARLKSIGSEARRELETTFERKVFLSLFVKVSPKWRENESFLKELDWRAMVGVTATADTPEES
jgi:GTP-binding protein Era